MIYNAIKVAAVALMIGLAVFAVRREKKHPLTLVTRVTEIVVMTKAHADDVRPEPQPGIVERIKKKIVLPHRDPPSRTKATDGSGDKWNFPYSCAKVKWYADHFTRDQLESMRKLAGEPEPTSAQERQIRECIAGRFQ